MDSTSPAGAIKSSHTIVLFHGLCATPLELAFLASYLRQAGFAVETPSIEGYAYGGPATRWKEWLAQATGIVSKLQEERDGGVSVGGLSMGATLALAVAAELDAAVPLSPVVAAAVLPPSPVALSVFTVSPAAEPATATALAAVLSEGMPSRATSAC